MPGFVTAKFLRLITAWLLAMVCCVGVYAAIPNSDNPDAYTEKQFRRDQYLGYKAIMSELYEEIGRKGPRWDGLVKELLDAKAAIYANSGADKEDKVEVSADRERLSAIMDDLEAMGCDDPLVRFIILVRPDQSNRDDPDKIKKCLRLVYPQRIYPSLEDIACRRLDEMPGKTRASW